MFTCSKVTWFFQKFIFKVQKCQKSWKNAPFFSEKSKFYLADARYDFHTFFRHSSEYLQYSVLSPKRFGQKEMKIEQKARPPQKNPAFFGGGQGGTSTDIREVCARRLKNYKNDPFLTLKFKFHSSSMQIDYFGKKKWKSQIKHCGQNVKVGLSKPFIFPI